MCSSVRGAARRGSELLNSAELAPRVTRRLGTLRWPIPCTINIRREPEMKQARCHRVSSRTGLLVIGAPARRHTSKEPKGVGGMGRLLTAISLLVELATSLSGRFERTAIRERRTTRTARINATPKLRKRRKQQPSVLRIANRECTTRFTHCSERNCPASSQCCGYAWALTSRLMTRRRTSGPVSLTAGGLHPGPSPRKGASLLVEAVLAPPFEGTPAKTENDRHKANRHEAECFNGS